MYEMLKTYDIKSYIQIMAYNRGFYNWFLTLWEQTAPYNVQVYYLTSMPDFDPGVQECAMYKRRGMTGRYCLRQS